jgi:hypothetical protein
MDELLQAVAGFLQDDILPNTSGRLRFHARVAGNVIQMLRRELVHLEAHVLREWEGLDDLLGKAELPGRMDERLNALQQRNEKLCDMIRSGNADEEPIRTQLHTHLRNVVLDKISVSDPRLAEEAAEGS